MREYRKLEFLRGSPVVPVVVLGLDSFTGLQTTRVFHSHGIPVVGLTSDPAHAFCKTRNCSAVIETKLEGPRLLETLLELGRLWDSPPILCPTSDTLVLQVSENRERLHEFYRFRLPDHATLRMLADKVDFARFAQQRDLPIPKTYLLNSQADLEGALDELTFPCYLKPRLRTADWIQHSPAKVFRVLKAAELRALYRSVSRWSDGMLVQRSVEGPDENHYTCNCYFDKDSRPLVTFVSQKLRQWPIFNGVGCLSIDADNPIVRNLTLQLFESTGFQGLGYLEFKKDQQNGAYYIIEPNVGRPTGRSALAEACGVELLHTMYCDLLGLDLPPNRTQKPAGVKWIYWRKDLCSAAYHFWHGKLSLSSWWKSLRGKKTSAVWLRTDPWPFVLDSLSALSRFVRRKKHHRDYN